MMRTFLLAAAACAALGTLSNSAFAGGDNGGTKNSGKIRVTNTSDEVAAVIVDVDQDNPPADMDEFLDAGGKVIQPGRSATFKVSAGSHTVSAVLVDDNGDELGDSDTIEVNPAKNKTVRLEVSGEDDAILDEA